MPKAETIHSTPAPVGRRSLFASAGAAALAAAVPASAAHPDAELIRLCAEHIPNIEAYNSATHPDEDPHWKAYERTRNAIGAARPRTMDGMLAKARAAKAEAATPRGEEDPHNCQAEDWAWDLVGDLLRLYGRA